MSMRQPVTSVSGSSTFVGWTLAQLPAVARLSLHAATIMMLGVPSCLVTSTTEFPVPAETPPYVDVNSAMATPRGGSGVPATKIVVLRQQDDVQSLEFSAYVQSEDNGRWLQGMVFVNYKLSPNVNHPYLSVGWGDSVPPGSFDMPRKVTATLSDPMVLTTPGCYQATLVITHSRNARVPQRQDDIAMVVWWILVEATPGSVKMGSCPGLPAVADAGVDNERD